MPSRWVMHDGVWQPLGGSIAPPPDPGTDPGGVWGDAKHNGTIHSRAGLAVQSSQWSLLNALGDGERVYGGLSSLGNLTTWTSNEELHIQRIGNGPNIMVRGGQVVGPMQEWNGTTGAYWETQGNPNDGNHYHGDAGYAITRGLDMILEFCIAKNTGDGISFGKQGLPGKDRVMGGADGSICRRCWVLRVGDDCFENDWKDEITLIKCFMSGMMCVSTRPGNSSTPENTDTRNKVMTIDGCLMWRRGMRFRDLTPQGGSLGQKCAFSFFKWQTDHGAGTGPEYGMQCHLHNSLLREDGDPCYTGQSNNFWGSLLTSGQNQRLTACSNNWLVMPYRTAGTYPPGWPKNDPIVRDGFSYAWGTEGANRWNDGANALAASTPEVTMTATDKGII